MKWKWLQCSRCGRKQSGCESERQCRAGFCGGILGPIPTTPPAIEDYIDASAAWLEHRAMVAGFRRE